jgi:hypothetical protein
MATKKQKEVEMASKASSRTPAAKPKPKKLGRPRAKHSDPSYRQVTAYIHEDVRLLVKARLLERGGEFSALVESLLREWLKLDKTSKLMLVEDR